MFQITQPESPASLQARASTIDVVSDVVCPWCLIGKRRLEKALTLIGRQDVRIRWKPFELNPSAPKDGMNRAEYRARKFGSADYARQLEARVASAGAADGITFQFDKIQTVPNTLDAHRLIWLAEREGVQNEVVERLFTAYFVEGQDVGSADVLARIAAGSGISSSLVDELRNTDLGTKEVRAEEEHSYRSGVSGVPTFFVNGQPVTSGAHAPELLAATLAPILGATSETCSLESGGCA